MTLSIFPKKLHEIENILGHEEGGHLLGGWEAPPNRISPLALISYFLHCNRNKALS